jgi:surface antigen
LGRVLARKAVEAGSRRSGGLVGLISVGLLVVSSPVFALLGLAGLVAGPVSQGVSAISLVVPEAGFDAVVRAGSLCAGVSASLVAGVVDAEEGWEEPAVVERVDSWGSRLCDAWVRLTETGRDLNWPDVGQELVVAACLSGVEAVIAAAGQVPDLLAKRVATVMRLAQGYWFMDTASLGEYAQQPGLLVDSETGAGSVVAPEGLIGDNYPPEWRARACPGCGYSPLGYAWGNCTDFVAWRLTNNQGLAASSVTGFGNGNQWAERAREKGYRVDQIPSPGAVAVSTQGQWGHVAIIARVNGNMVTVEEYNSPVRYKYHYRQFAWPGGGFSSVAHIADYKEAG